MEPNVLLALRNTSGPFELERAYRFVDDITETKLTFTFVMQPRGAMRALFPLLRPVIARQVRANIRRIPSLVAHATATGG